MKIKLLIAAIAAVIAVLWASYNSNQTATTNSVSSAADQTGNAASSAQQATSQPSNKLALAKPGGSDWGNSPFALGTPASDAGSGANGNGANPALASPEPEVISAAEAARRQKMEKLGYMLPPDYYRKDLASLKKLAQSGDGFAMMHLGERYYFELNGQPQNPDYDARLDYRELARQEFMASLVAGKVRPAGIISELYLQEHNVVDAYAWHLLSDKLGDSISAEWFRRTRDYQNLTDNDKQLAQVRLNEIQQRLNQMAKQTGSTQQF